MSVAGRLGTDIQAPFAGLTVDLYLVHLSHHECTLCWTYCGLVFGAPLTPRMHPLQDLLWTCIWCTLCWTYCGLVFGAPLTPRVHPLLDLLWTCIWCTSHTTSAPFAGLTVDLYLVHLSHHECTLCWTYCGLVFGAPLTPRVHPLLDLLWTCIWCTSHTTSAPFAGLTVDLYLVHLSHHECTLCCLQMLSPTTGEKDTFCSTMLFLRPSIVPYGGATGTAETRLLLVMVKFKFIQTDM